ncbi:MAG: hypothetical protein Q8930_07145, partial [Bacillota bacterium]|nr:hypothetical protein [Bacillota bacterium]
LEAAASGCSIVSTNQGSAAEYFGDKAIYCDPYDEGSIYDAVKQGIKAGRDPELKRVMQEKFNWENCVRPLYESYGRLMDESLQGL